jgi:multiple sugar transport system permease protein
MSNRAAATATVRARWFAAPFVLGVVVLVVVPLAITLGLAFTNHDALGTPRFTGLANLRRLAGDPLFRTALWNSLIFVALAVPLRLAAVLGATLLFAARRPGAPAGRAAVYLPTIVPEIATALAWVWIVNPLFGPLPLALRALGVEQGWWLLDPWGARTTLALVSAFTIGEGFLVALAARHDIPQRYYEAAAVEGAGPWWTLRRITLPLLTPVLALLVARDIAVSVQTSFVPALVITGGGPINATTFLSLESYRNAFSFFRFGYASAMTLVIYVLTIALVGAQVLVVRRWWRADGAGAN